MEKYGYRFSFGPWNIHSGADPFGPPVRPSRTFGDKLGVYQELGFDAVQFHDDDAVPNMDDLAPAQIRAAACSVREQLDDRGLVAEFVAPRLWEPALGIDGSFTSNNPKERAYALERSKRAADIAQELGTDLMVPSCGSPWSPSPMNRWIWPSSPPWGTRWPWASRRMIPHAWGC